MLRITHNFSSTATTVVVIEVVVIVVVVVVVVVVAVAAAAVLQSFHLGRPNYSIPRIFLKQVKRNATSGRMFH